MRDQGTSTDHPEDGMIGIVQLRPNPPRMVTVVVAVALAVVGAILAWPIEPAIGVLTPLANVLSPIGLGLDQQTGFLFLFLSPALLVVGSLLPNI